LQQIEKLMTDMKDLIMQRISHPYLQKYIQTPNIDKDKLLLIISMLDQHGLTKLEMKDFVVTTMLIQIALDTHELVSNTTNPIEKETSLKSRQLTVLAGDYFSGLYYKILADSNNLAMIRALSEGIKEINEHKIFLYQKDSDGIEKLMNNIWTIESALINKLADYLHESIWKDISSHLLFMKRLLVEKKMFLNEGTSLLFDALAKVVFPKNIHQLELSAEQRNYLLLICDKYVDFSVKKVEAGIQKIPEVNETLKNRWSNILLQHDPIAKTYVEEG
jgi:heptaprenyl diphosphate synthase